MRIGESQRKDLIYQYRYTDIRGKWLHSGNGISV
ncbi:integrase DNA-binding domain-containing protein [Hungatella effluvii]